ncbi:GNAT family N-acetyltransferase [Paenibacillus kyungheensis]
MTLQSERLTIKPLVKKHIESLLALEVKNKEFFKAFTGKRNEFFYTYEGQAERVHRFLESSEQDTGYCFLIFLKNTETVIGEVILSEVVRGNLQSGWIGYFLDQDYNGKGYMSEAVQAVVKYAVEELKLHRIEAGVMPHNIGSTKVLLKSGFTQEGTARKNVKINGVWQDHITFAIIEDDLQTHSD